MEKLADKIKRLSRELERTKELVAACRHEYGNPEPATREYSEPVYQGLEPHGSDPTPIYNYIKKLERGWKRTCQKCGHYEYTNKTKPVAFGPDFEKAEGLT